MTQAYNRPMARSSSPTLHDIGRSNLRDQGVGPVKSFVQAAEALEVAVSLATIATRMVDEGLGWPTQAEYAARKGVSERSAQREWQRFQKAYGEKPDRMARAIIARAGARAAKDPVAEVFELPATVLAG